MTETPGTPSQPNDAKLPIRDTAAPEEAKIVQTKAEQELNPDTFVNREMAWIEFNQRVLEEARDEKTPLLERLKFLAIFSNNLDEFYMVRVAGYHNKLSAGVTRARPDGYKPNELLYTIRDLVLDMVTQQRNILVDVLTALEAEGVQVVEPPKLPHSQRAAARSYFEREVFPVLTPLAVDHARPFPFISNLSLSLAIWLRRSDDPQTTPEFVRLKVPDDVLPRIITMRQILQNHGSVERDDSSSNYQLIWLEDLISDNLDLLFSGMDVLESHSFRVTRNADIDYEYELDQDEEEYDMSTLIEESVRSRQFGPVVRLAVNTSISERTLDRLIAELDVIPDRDVYFIDGTLGASGLFSLYGAVKRPDLRDDPYVPHVPEVFQTPQSIFDVIRRQDHMVHHPYDSFNPVEEFFRAAARDPNVLAIKATLYRVGKNSPIVKSLLEARENDKQVAVLVELKARFDEENNLEWSRAMEKQGVHVIYGVEELPVKTHAKIALVVRREGDAVRRYVHLGTGNYNPSTAKLYTDVGLFTCNEEITDDASRLFNRLTGYAPSTSYNRLLVAPEYLQQRLIELLDGEITAARAGKKARVIFKMNQLEEDGMIVKLYEASQAGVQVDLIVRGLCCLRPGVPGLSENIRVTSIIGRFLEHSRVYYFHNAPEDQRIYCGSADLMRRNLLNRVEVVYPVLNLEIQANLLRMLRTQLIDNVGAWEMLPDASYRRVKPREGEKLVSSQHVFMEDGFGLSEDDLPPL